MAGMGMDDEDGEPFLNEEEEEQLKKETLMQPPKLAVSKSTASFLS